MSKWEDSFKKATADFDSGSTCQCTSNQGLFIPSRQLSMIVAGLLFLSFCIFITGYFLGKKCVVEQFTQTMQSSVLDDNIHVTATSPIHETQGNDTTVAIHAENNTAPLGSNEILVHHEPIVNINQNIATPDEGEQKHYYAQLIGFGTEKAAEQFVKRLASNGVTTEIKKRVSKTVKGRTSYWYQVVTTAYANKDDLSRIVDKLVKEEKLKDVCIRTC